MTARADSLATSLKRKIAARLEQVRPPTTDAIRVRQYGKDPYGFAREVLGIDLWSKQKEILQCVANHKRVAVVSGNKCGKSLTLAVLAIWFYCTHPGARIIITATTDKQVNQIIWKEIKKLVRNSRIPIPGARGIAKRAQTGLHDPATDSHILGFTASDKEAMAGYSGARTLWIVDEASGIDEDIFEAIEGNRAGGGSWVFLISNPTKSEGEFHAAFHSKSDLVLGAGGYHGIHIDSRDGPNCSGEWRQMQEWDRASDEWRPREEPIPGIAMPAWIEEKIREYGEDSAFVQVRIAAKFLAAEASKIFPFALLEEAESRWDDLEIDPQARLYIGDDPAGEGRSGDESAFTSRIGAKILEVRSQRGLSPQGHIDVILDLIAASGRGARSPVPIVNVDSEGETGWRVWLAIKAYSEAHGTFWARRISSPNGRAIRKPTIYFGLREELHANAREWLRGGGAIPTDPQLKTDLHAPEWESDNQGRLKVTHKDEVRKQIGRSPDRGDSFLLCCWEQNRDRLADSANQFDATGAKPAAANPYEEPVEDLWDPYSGPGAMGR